MQKLLSSAIYTICLILLSLAYINGTKDFLSGFAPFNPYEAYNPAAPKTITAESLGITSSAAEPSKCTPGLIALLMQTVTGYLHQKMQINSFQWQALLKL